MSFEWTKYLRVFPILGLMLYYLGGLIMSLDPGLDAAIFLLQIILFSILSLIGLGLQHRELMMIGSIILIIGSAGPVFYFISSIAALIGMTLLGGALITLAILFHLLTFIAWFKN